MVDSCSEVAKSDAEKESEARCKAMLDKLISEVKKQTVEMEDLAVRMNEIAVGLKAIAQPQEEPVHALPPPGTAPTATRVTKVDHAVAATTSCAEAAHAPESPTKCSTSGPNPNVGYAKVAAMSLLPRGATTAFRSHAELMNVSSSKSFDTGELDIVTPTRCSTARRSCNIDVAITSPAPSIGATSVCADTCIRQVFDAMPGKSEIAVDKDGNTYTLEVLLPVTSLLSPHIHLVQCALSVLPIRESVFLSVDCAPWGRANYQHAAMGQDEAVLAIDGHDNSWINYNAWSLDFSAGVIAAQVVSAMEVFGKMSDRNKREQYFVDMVWEQWLEPWPSFKCYQGGVQVQLEFQWSPPTQVDTMILEQMEVDNRIAKLMVELFHTRAVVISNSLISMYAKCGNLQNAEFIFSLWAERDIVPWTSMITAYSQVGNIMKAREFFYGMSTRNVLTWNTMLGAFIQHGAEEDGLKMYSAMLSEKDVIPDWVTYVTLFRGECCINAHPLFAPISAHPLKAFNKFENTSDALSAATLLIDSKPSKGLHKFLRKHGDGETLAVADSKLGNAIKEKLKIDCLHNSTVMELRRGLRNQVTELMSGRAAQDLGPMSLGLSNSLSRYKLKFSTEKIDTMIIQAIGLLDDLDKELNTYAMRVREWYGWHFPELTKIVADNIQYAKAVKMMGNHANAVNFDFSEILPEDVEAELKEAAVISMGTEVSDLDLLNIRELCDQLLALSEYSGQLYDYLKSRMNTIAPNLTALVGELVGTCLIAHDGSLMNLAKQPGSTIQIPGDFYGLDIPIAFCSRLNLQQILHLSISEQQKRGNGLVIGISYIQVVLGMTVLQVPWDPGGDLSFFAGHSLQRLGVKPHFKEGGMSRTDLTWSGLRSFGPWARRQVGERVQTTKGSDFN